MLGFLLSWLVSSFLNGLFFFVLFAFSFYWFYLKELPTYKAPTQPQFEDFVLSPALLEMLSRSDEGATSADGSSLLAINLLCQFLFQELKDAKAVRRYIIRKMSAEFQELLNSKAIGRLVRKLTARDFSVGTSFPIIKSLKVLTHQLDHAGKTIQELSLLLDIDYKNGFSLSVDADLILGRSAYVHIKIASIKGKARLQFTRTPFTHWNFAFVEDPQIDFAATSHFDGKHIPQLTAMILNQLRRSVRRKHTMPNYKCRFKPFFETLYAQKLYRTDIEQLLLQGNGDSSAALRDSFNDQEHLSDSNSSEEQTGTGDVNHIDAQQTLERQFARKNNQVPSYARLCSKLGYDLTSLGVLQVRLKSCERLPEWLWSLNAATVAPAVTAATPGAETTPSTVVDSSHHCAIWLTLSVDATSMQTLMSKQICKEHWPLLDFELTRSNLNQSLGIVFTETFFVNRIEVVIQKVFPNSMASNIVNLQRFDIVHSLNQVRITSVKQLNKIVQKTGAGVPLRFVVQRPCILAKEPTTRTSVTFAKSTSTMAINGEQTIPPNKLNNNTTLQTPQAPTVATSSSTVSSTATEDQPIHKSTSSSSLVSHTRQRFGRLEQKLKSFGAGGGVFASTTNTSTSQPNVLSTLTSTPTPPKTLALPLTVADQMKSNASSGSLLMSPGVSGSNAASPLNSSLPPVPPPPPPPLVVVTHSASASCLVDFFCSVAETPSTEPLGDLDLIRLLTGSKPSEPKRQAYFKSTGEIKLEKEHLIANIPLSIDQTHPFDLHQQTKFLNIFLWTVQYLGSGKTSRIKNLLIGYISVPLYEVTSDCWNTSKGESQSTVYFTPLEEVKATAAVSKLTRSHVISDHPGFDANLCVGSLTVNFQHRFTPPTAAVTPEPASPAQSPAEAVSNLVEAMAQELNEQKALAKELAASLPANAPQQQADDGSSHKFHTALFNDAVFCEFCNKKIWLKNAYQCAYCGYTVHFKCYDKTIGKSICGRYFANRSKLLESAITPSDVSSIKSNDDDFLVIPSEATTISLDKSEERSGDTGSGRHSIQPRALVSNLLSGIRQRRWPLAAANQATTVDVTKRHVGSSDDVSKLKPVTDDEDDDSFDTADDFKDIDASEDKFFGIELFDELEPRERKLKFEETIAKYQTTIEMMSKLKMDLEAELAACAKAKQVPQHRSFLLTGALHSSDAAKRATALGAQEEQKRSQLKHLEEQMKCVVFLLMQCQVGLENCNELVNETAHGTHVDTSISSLNESQNVDKQTLTLLSSEVTHQSQPSVPTVRLEFDDNEQHERSSLEVTTQPEPVSTTI